MSQVLFLIIAVIGLAAALGTVLARNLVRAALYLIAFFFTVACVFVLLEAEFLAALQVLIYIGAVAILLMFGIMLTRNIQGDDPSSTPSAWKLPGLAAGLGVFFVLAYGISHQKGVGGQYSWSAMEVRPAIDQVKGENGSPRTRSVNNMGKVVGEELMTRYVIAFEVAGLLLTAALVGAIAIAHREDVEPPAPSGASRFSQRSAGPLAGDGASLAPVSSREAESAAPATAAAH